MSKWNETPDSSNVAGFGYDHTTKILTVEFKNRSRYEYYDVPNQNYEEMKSATSVGKYLNSKIKGTYEYKEIST